MFTALRKAVLSTHNLYGETYEQNNLFVRMWRAVSGADDKAFAAAHVANDTPEVHAVVCRALGGAEYKKLLPEADPLDPEKLWKPGTDPALWGDILLLASRNNSTAEDANKHIEAFHKAGGKFSNRPDKDGNRPTDYIFNDAYQAYAHHFDPGRGDKATRLVALVNIGVTFDQKGLHSLTLVIPKKEIIQIDPRRRGPDCRYTVSVDDPEHAYYKFSKPRQDVLDRLREGMAKAGPKSNVIPFARLG